LFSPFYVCDSFKALSMPPFCKEGSQLSCEKTTTILSNSFFF
jgi:hypothetical protein